MANIYDQFVPSEAPPADAPNPYDDPKLQGHVALADAPGLIAGNFLPDLESIPADIWDKAVKLAGNAVDFAGEAVNDPAAAAKKAAAVAKNLGLTAGASALSALLPGEATRLGLGDYSIPEKIAKAAVKAGENPSETAHSVLDYTTTHPARATLDALSLIASPEIKGLQTAGDALLASTADRGLIGGLAAKAAGNTLKAVGNGVSMGDLTPGNLALKTGTGILKGIDNKVVLPFLGMTTGTGNAAAWAQQAGLLGGQVGKAFLGQLRKFTPDQIRAAALAAKQKGLQTASDAFGVNAAPWKAITTPVAGAGNNIIQSLIDARDMLPSRGVTKLSNAPHDVLDDMTDEVLDHLHQYGETPSSLHDLKLKLQPALSEMKPGTTPYKAVTHVLSTIRSELAKVPGYDETMAQFADPVNAINQAVDELSMGARAKKGTTVNALLSALRPNDGGGGLFASRAQALNELTKYDPTLPYQLAGGLMNPVIARGLWGRGATLNHVLETSEPAIKIGGEPAAAGIGGLVGGAAAGKIGAILGALHGLFALPATVSPRFNAVGRYMLGSSTRGARNLGLTQRNLGLLGEGLRLKGEQDQYDETHR